MKAAPADPLTRPRLRASDDSREHRFPSFGFLEVLSFVHSGVYAVLIFFWLGPTNETATMLLGWAHGLLWIAMSLLCIVAARRRTIPFWLAVVVAVIGGLGPFAGTIGFVWEQHRRRQQATG
ncbi:hypothetical protein [Conexibacter sp. CPCC 206217]|uniref:hypothetical protein n=1 Tax=Conexibacter sp. CPCC 206217 TaxID=3064574 RepID=UPI002728FEE9|nr:hypothetical protein [Conexibacter sp. CPCC 206217]MDO8211845.1 hypothetical protein [Conexibacter sp. CPCC 206217]